MQIFKLGNRTWRIILTLTKKQKQKAITYMHVSILKGSWFSFLGIPESKTQYILQYPGEFLFAVYYPECCKRHSTGEQNKLTDIDMSAWAQFVAKTTPVTQRNSMCLRKRKRYEICDTKRSTQAECSIIRFLLEWTAWNTTHNRLKALVNSCRRRQNEQSDNTIH